VVLSALRPLSAVVLSLVTACVSPTTIEAVPADAVDRSGPFDVLEEQPVADANLPLALYPEGEGQNLVQTFSVDKNRWEMGYMELPVGCASGVLLQFRIREGIDGPVLYAANVIGLPEVVDGTFQLLQTYDPFGDGPIRLRKNTEYAIELASFPGEGATETTCGMASGPAGDSYAGGQGFYRDPVNSPTDWLPLTSGAPDDQHDLPFAVLGR